MVALRLATALAVLAVLLAPSASAAEADGTFVISGEATLPGLLGVDAVDPRIRFHDQPELTAQAATILVERIGERNTLHGTPLGAITTSGKFRDEARHGASSLRLEAGAGSPLIALSAPGAQTLTGQDATMRPVGAALVFGQTSLNNDRCVPGQPCLDAFGVHELVTRNLDARFEGELVLYLYGITAVVEEAGETVRYESGVLSDGTGLQQEEATLVVRLSGATAILNAQQAVLYAPTLSITADEAIFQSATGALEVGIRTYRAAAAHVATAGALLVEPQSVAPANAYGSTGTTVYADEFRARITGDVSSINLAAVPLYKEAPAESAGFAALLAATVAALAYFWPHLQFHAAAMVSPLYTRLQPPKLLDNDVRSGIYEIIRTNPGISARAVHRKSTHSWGTVVYHLRQLENHHLVVSRSFGRARNYYENHGKYKGMEQQLACLRSPRARSLAQAILHEPGVTQEGLAVATGMAQPTTSYYARKLAQAQLVTEARKGRYVRYLPTAELERFLRLADEPDAAALAAQPVAQA